MALYPRYLTLQLRLRCTTPKAFRSSTLAPPLPNSAQQQAICDEFASGDRHITVKAYAGTGKTSTIYRAIPCAPEKSIFVGAFGKANQLELEERLAGTDAVTQTWHAVGYHAIRENWGTVQIADKRTDRADALAKAVCGGLGRTTERLVARLVTKAREILPLATMPGELIDLAEEFDCLPDRWSDLTPYGLAMLTFKAMDLAADKPSPCGIDFADEIFLPLRHGWLRPRFDMVIGDEAQDMSHAQLLMMEAVCGGRLVLVGDPHQAIYTFRGAEGDALDLMREKHDALEFPLSITYRCPTSVVDVARRYVADYEARPNAPVGVVDSISGMDALVTCARPTQFVLSRKNAPLMPLALRLLREGVPARVQGRDIGQGLIGLVRQLSKGVYCPTAKFLGTLHDWERDQAERLTAAGKEDRIERVRDRVETLVALSLDCTHTEALIARLDTLFADGARIPQVVCSTVHKAKGLEADRVFVLEDTLKSNQPCVCHHFHTWGTCKQCGCRAHVVSPKRAQEERNIAYVAVTRSKDTLTWVKGVA